MAQIFKYKNKRTNKTMYAFKAYLGKNPAGKRIETTRRGFRTAKEAKAALALLKNDFDQNGWDHKNQSIKTVNDLFELWYKSFKNSVKQTYAHENYKRYTLHAGKEIGNYRVDKITPQILQKMANEWSNKYKNYRNFLTPLKQVLDYGVRMGIIDSSPLSKIIYPKKKNIKSKRSRKINARNNFYNLDQLKQLFAALYDNNDWQLTAYFRILAFTGLRPGEASALRWADIDLIKNTVSVKRTLLVDKVTKEMVLNPPKTKASIRTVSFDKNTANIIRRWKMIQQQYFLMIGINIKDKAFVFSNQKNPYKPHRPQTVNKWLIKICKEYNLKYITPHGLRHTHDTLLIESGAPIKAVQARMGHANIETTLNIYAHATDHSKREAAKDFAKYVDF